MGERRAARILRRGLSLLRRLADTLVGIVLAPRCVACEQALDAPLHGPACHRCWDAIDDSGRYEGPLREIIHAFKYEGRRSLARPLALRMRARGVDTLQDADCVVPVPLHVGRRLRRGVNQAADLAQHLERPVVHALWRTRHTAPQTGLPAVARRRNVRRAFRLSPLLTRRARAALIAGRVVVLVDDVMTTGATLAACAAVLRAAGAREVRTLTVARAMPPQRATSAHE